jgi:hypothetical protein
VQFTAQSTIGDAMIRQYVACRPELSVAAPGWSVVLVGGKVLAVLPKRISTPLMPVDWAHTTTFCLAGQDR